MESSQRPTESAQRNQPPSTLAQERATKSNAIEIPQISLPKGGGAIKGIDETFQVNAANGTASFSIPLPFSPNRNGFTPQLALSYNSGAGNGLFGLGWNVGLPSIQRRTDKKLPRYFDTNDTDKIDQEDSFMFSGVEELVPYLNFQNETWEIRQETQGDFTIRQYRPRIEGGFSRIERIFQPDKGYYWRVTSRENVTTFFGFSPECRIADPTDVTKVFQWLPEFSFDDKGSWVKYEYKAEDLNQVENQLHEKNRFNNNQPFTNRHLKRIKYGNREAYYSTKVYEIETPNDASHFFELAFDYGEHDLNNPLPTESTTWPSRADAFSTYRAGFDIRTYRLCQRVLMFHTFPELNNYTPTLVRSLNFDYEFSSLYESPASLTQTHAEVTYLAAIEQMGYIKNGSTYTQKSLPKMTFEYQKLKWNREVKTVDAESLVHAPTGLSGNYQWVDLYNEGINGILTEQANAWYYKHNLGEVTEQGVVQFSHAKEVISKPSLMGISSGVLQLQDLNADGQKQLVVTTEGMQGYFELSDKDEWQPFVAFAQRLNLNLRDPNIRMFDLNGDGKPEVVLTDQGAFTIWENLGKIGYDSPEVAAIPFDEEKGPTIVFSDPEQRIFLADMSGDGLTDIIRIRNGEVCYWPNQGYGKFGAKITMSHSPWFDDHDLFNPDYLQLADISGTGATDLIYLGKNQFKVYLNLSGNAWSAPESIEPFFPTELPNRIAVTDLLGNGTGCLVWSSELPTYQQAPMRYMDLMGGVKPHIMKSHANGMGKRTEVEYKSSTYFYLKDKLSGTPWITKLPFPVHVISKTVVTDQITNARFTAQYTYHHGYYDHTEREFRGFGRVDQIDTETYEEIQIAGASNGTESVNFHEPPVLTKTWYHTGCLAGSLGNATLLKQYEQEYWYNLTQPPALSDDVLDDAWVDFSGAVQSLSAKEWREVARACKGMVLRQEVFALDNSLQERIPYTVATHTCHIRPLQAQHNQRYGVYVVLESEAITFSYERKPDDARVAHSFNLTIDDLGNVLESVAVVYGRKAPLKSVLPVYKSANVAPKHFGKKTEAEVSTMQAAHQTLLDEAQHKTHLVLTESTFTNDVLETNAYRLRLPYQVKTYELLGLSTPQNAVFTRAEIAEIMADNGTEIDYTNPTNAPAGKRIIEHIQTLYLSNDLANPLPLGQLESLALPWEAYQLAFTPEILTKIYGNKLPPTDWDTTLLNKSKYEKIDGTNYWISSGKPLFLSPSRSLNQIREAFYVPVGYEDPFEIQTSVKWDDHTLFITQTTDALDNETAIEAFDYRTLSPTKLRDINGNFAETITDALGMTVATAIYGKDQQGDTLNGGDWAFTPQQINDFFAAPHTHAATLLGNATACMLYDLEHQPARVASVLRESHFRTLQNGVLTENAASKYQISIEYSDGLGNVALKKVQAEPEALGGPLRWIGNGRTILNNKGKPIKQYEPYFSDNPDYEPETTDIRNEGVTPVLYYDAIGRNIRTDFPDGTFSKVTFDAWEQRSYDPNDTVLESAWYTQHQTLPNTDPQKIAATNAAIHANTPSVLYLDSLGRPFLSMEHNVWEQKGDISVATQRFEAFYPTYATLDIEGNALSLTDARNNAVMTWQYDLLGHRLHQTGMDNGFRLLLNDCLGKPLHTWDNRQHEFTFDYDTLHRPTHQWLQTNGGTPQLIEEITYGESTPNAAANLRGQVLRHRDGSGQITHLRFDFKGNLLEVQKRFPQDAKAEVIDWQTASLDNDIYTQQTEYDALNRMSRLYNWYYDLNRVAVYIPQYSARGVLESEVLVLNAQKTPNGYTGGTTQQVVSKLRYDAKGQRQTMQHGNGITTTYTYDKETFRLLNLKTINPLLAGEGAGGGVIGGGIQALSYTYDPVGNITHLRDDAYQTVFFNNQQVEPQSTYTYDALYRLIEATGRENITFNQAPQAQAPSPLRVQMPIADLALRNYTQTYQYDAVGNILQMRHKAGNGSLTQRWTRAYNYASDSNRLLSTHTNNPSQNVTYRYDTHGNMLNTSPTPQDMVWDYQDMLQTYNMGGGGMAYYQYGSDKQRSRKYIQKQGGITEERLYLGGTERYRRWQGSTLQEEIETHHLFEGDSRLLMVDNVISSPEGGGWVGVKYQISNHLGSTSLELDENANIISYEEYHPYGTTAYHAQNATIQATAKRYRYTGMERDEESGLAYHTARYYLPWLGRWLSADPIGVEGAGNLYGYSDSNVIVSYDTNGLQPVNSYELQYNKKLPYDLQTWVSRYSRDFFICKKNEEISIKDKIKIQPSMSEYDPRFAKPLSAMPGTIEYTKRIVKEGELRGGLIFGALTYEFTGNEELADFANGIFLGAGGIASGREYYRNVGQSIRREKTVSAYVSPNSRKPTSSKETKPDFPSTEVKPESPITISKVKPKENTSQNITRQGIPRNNPKEWRKTRDSWDKDPSYKDILSKKNRELIAKGKTPVVDQDWIKVFTEDTHLLGEKISIHHIHGGLITVPLPKSSHYSVHGNGNFKGNSGGATPQMPGGYVKKKP